MSARKFPLLLFTLFLSWELNGSVNELIHVPSGERTDDRSAATISFTNNVNNSKINRVLIRVYEGAACTSPKAGGIIQLGPVGGGVSLGATGAKTIGIRADSLYTILDNNSQLSGAATLQMQFESSIQTLRMQSCGCFDVSCGASTCSLSPTSDNAGTFTAHPKDTCSHAFITDCSEIDTESLCLSSPLSCLWFGICIPADR